MAGSLRIGTINGIDIYIHISWLIAIVLLAISTASSWFPRLYPGAGATTYLLMGLIAALLLFLSVLLHELGHSFVARWRGMRVQNIVLFIFGGVSNIEQEPKNPSTEFLITIVGPLVSLLLGALAALLLLPLGNRPSPTSAILTYLATANILLGIFNLIPGFPLDGGRVLRSIIWKITGKMQTATQVTTVVGQLIAYLFILLGIWWLFSGDSLDGIWLGFIGWFMLSAAQAVRAQSLVESTLGNVTVAEVMSHDVMTVQANISLQRLIDEYFLPQGLHSALVMQGDQLAGVISLNEIRRIPREEWGGTPVGLAMLSADKLHTIAPQQYLKEVLPLMSNKDVNQLPVVQDGRLVGVLSRDAIIRSLEIRRTLGLRRSP
ncbi:MAG: site-2 protease family protein [Ktedonobacteraceae bacterium]|nr:site-2 protease family protein [Ktedonobacteraceae bacterium]